MPDAKVAKVGAATPRLIGEAQYDNPPVIVSPPPVPQREPTFDKMWGSTLHSPCHSPRVSPRASPLTSPNRSPHQSPSESPALNRKSHNNPPQKPKPYSGNALNELRPDELNHFKDTLQSTDTVSRIQAEDTDINGIPWLSPAQTQANITTTQEDVTSSPYYATVVKESHNLKESHNVKERSSAMKDKNTGQGKEVSSIPFLSTSLCDGSSNYAAQLDKIAIEDDLLVDSASFKGTVLDKIANEDDLLVDSAYFKGTVPGSVNKTYEACFNVDSFLFRKTDESKMSPGSLPKPGGLPLFTTHVKSRTKDKAGQNFGNSEIPIPVPHRVATVKNLDPNRPVPLPPTTKSTDSIYSTFGILVCPSSTGDSMCEPTSLPTENKNGGREVGGPASLPMPLSESSKVCGPSSIPLQLPTEEISAALYDHPIPRLPPKKRKGADSMKRSSSVELLSPKKTTSTENVVENSDKVKRKSLSSMDSLTKDMSFSDIESLSSMDSLTKDMSFIDIEGNASLNNNTSQRKHGKKNLIEFSVSTSHGDPTPTNQTRGLSEVLPDTTDFSRNTNNKVMNNYDMPVPLVTTQPEMLPASVNITQSSHSLLVPTSPSSDNSSTYTTPSESMLDPFSMDPFFVHKPSDLSEQRSCSNSSSPTVINTRSEAASIEDLTNTQSINQSRLENMVDPLTGEVIRVAPGRILEQRQARPEFKSMKFYDGDFEILMEQGYSREDITKALMVANNNFSIARKILKEYPVSK